MSISPTSEMKVSTEEQRGVVRFLTAEGAGGREIHNRRFIVYDEHCMSCSRVLEWHKGFRDRRRSLQEGHDDFLRLQGPTACRLSRAWSYNQCASL